MKKLSYSLLAAASLPLVAFGQFTFDSINQTYTQNFNTFDGTSGSLSSEWSSSVSDHPSRNIDPVFRGEFNSGTNSAPDFTGVMAATNGTSGNSIVWRERTGPVELDDFRLILSVQNKTSQAITGFEFSYVLETWINGRRDNELRFKYDTIIDEVLAGRATFETDILERNGPFTQNPNHTPIISNDNADQFVLDGSLEENRTVVTGFIDLTTLDDGTGNAFGPLDVGETAHLRWQISNNQLTSGGRSALGINDLSVTAVPEPSAFGAIFGVVAMAGVFLRRRIRR